jgi:hypothetical protein
VSPLALKDFIAGVNDVLLGVLFREGYLVILEGTNFDPSEKEIN